MRAEVMMLLYHQVKFSSTSRGVIFGNIFFGRLG